jgi:hypothetical protein
MPLKCSASWRPDSRTMFRAAPSVGLVASSENARKNVSILAPSPPSVGSAKIPSIRPSKPLRMPSREE